MIERIMVHSMPTVHVFNNPLPSFLLPSVQSIVFASLYYKSYSSSLEKKNNGKMKPDSGQIEAGESKE